MLEKTYKLRKTSGTFAVIFIIIISIIVAFPNDLVDKIEKYILGNSYINMMEISDQKVSRGWTRFDLSYMKKEDLGKSVIYLDFPYTEGISVYEPIKGQDLYKNIIPSRNILKTYYQLSSDFDSSKYLFIFLENPEKGMKINLCNYDDFFTIQNLEIASIAAIIGFVLAFLIINIILYKSTSDSIYIWHAVYMAVMIVTMYIYSGMIFFLTGIKTSYILIRLMKMLTEILFLSFTYRYLIFGKKSEIKENIYMFISFIFLIIFIVTAFLLHRNMDMGLEELFMFSYVLIIISALIFYYRYDHVSVYYLVGTLILQFGCILNSLSEFNWIKNSVIIRMFFYMSIGLESLFFTMSIIEDAKTEKILHQKLEDKVVTDALTGLKNRYYCDTNIKNEFFTKNSEKNIISMLIIDIDYFKNINDSYGHVIGDGVLAELSNILTSSVRSTDVVIRWGGEEFLIVLPNVRLIDANSIANKINKAISANNFKNVKNITVSIGVAEKYTEESFESLFKRCDKALYVAKQNGRDCFASARGVLGNGSPVVLKWSNSLECGNEIIDIQHRKMHLMMNDLLEHYFDYGIDDKFEKKFNEAIVFIKKHFEDEENLLRQWGYPQVEEHSKMHSQLIDNTFILKEKVENKNINKSELLCYVVNEVVFGHLVDEDKDFYSYVR